MGGGGQASTPNASTPCMSKMMHDLGVLNLKGNIYGDCTRGAGCLFKHVDVASTPKPALVTFVQAMAVPRANGAPPLLKSDVVQQAMDKIAALP